MTASIINDKQYTNTSVATEKAWMQDVHNFLAAAGWVQTADTGQLNIAGIGTAVGALNTAVGYEIWRMADALQATAPVFIKLEYGSGSAADHPGFWLTVGQGSDGAGNITGTKVSSRKQLKGGGPWPNPSYIVMSGSSSRFAFATHGQNSNTAWCWGIERTKNADGTDNTDGVIALMYADSGNYRQSHSLVLTPSVAAPQDWIVNSGGGERTPQYGPLMNTHSTVKSSNDGSNVGTFPIAQASRRGAENPGMNFLGYWMQDFASRSQPVVNYYGADHTYIALGWDTQADGAGGINQVGNPTDNQQMLLMRFE